jgi:hypothetical protein
MNRIKFILLLPVLLACIDKNEKQEPLHSNKYYSVYTNFNEKTHEIDSVIVIDKKGTRSIYALNSEFIGEYPQLYKDRLISIIYGPQHSNLITFNLSTHQIDTLCSNIQFLTTDAIDEYEGRVVVRGYESYCIVDVEKKHLQKTSKCYLENILLVDTNYFLIRTLNDISEPKPYLCKGSINGTEDFKLIDLPGMGVQHYSDATTLGWNGMTIYQGILFIHTMNQLLAYDIQKNLIIDSIEEGREVSYQLKKVNPVFSFEKKEKIIFDLKKRQFKRV